MEPDTPVPLAGSGHCRSNNNGTLMSCRHDLLLDTSLSLELLKQYYQLTPHSHKNIEFHNNTLREVDDYKQLQRVFFSFAVLTSSRCNITKRPIVVMVTASHNPPGYNGLKVDGLGQSLPFSQQQLEDVVNSEQVFKKLVQTIEINKSNKLVDIFLARDARPTSQGLSRLMNQTFLKLGIKVIDIGQGTTPQTFSMSEFLFEKINQNIDEQKLCQLQKAYFQQISDSFKSIIILIQNHKNKKWQKKQLYLDFGNGVGAISFKHYQFFHEFFNCIQVNNKQFHLPNVKCGAQWLKKNEKKIQFSQFPKADSYYFFDGDSDRIIAKFYNHSAITDGDDFNACFMTILIKLINECKINRTEVKVGCVGNIVCNYGLDQYMNGVLGIQVEKASIGVKNLYQAACRYDCCSYFQSSGHGCYVFSQKMLSILSQLSSQFWQAELLLLIHKISRNNSRGYALHNALMLQIFMFWSGSDETHLFTKKYIIQKTYQLINPDIFINHDLGKKLLTKPQNLVQIFKQLQTQYPNVQIIIRKSNTTPILKVALQGEQQACQQLFISVNQTIKEFLNL